MADISNVINVSLLAGSQLALADNMNSVALITTDRTFLNSNKRYAVYANAAQVAADFGSASDVAVFANKVFSQSPNPVNAGGQLVVGYWRSSAEAVPATAGYLSGAQLNENNAVSELQKISNGEMTILIDTASVALTALNFSVIDSMADVVSILDAALATATVSYSNLKLTITSDTTGVASTVDFATDAGGGGDFVGALLGLVDGSGAIKVDGVAATNPAAETEAEALSELSSLVAFKGFCFMDESTDPNRLLIAAWAQANSVLAYDVFSGATNLVRDVANVPWNVKLSGYDNYRMIYSKANNRALAAAYMARLHTVNFNVDASAITMNLKTLVGVSPEDYTQTEINEANAIGLDLYTTIKNVPVVLCSEGNDFADNVYNLIAYIQEAKVDAFNLLKSVPTKISQTTEDVNSIVNTVRQTTIKYVSAKVFGPGKWTRADSFGDLDTFNRSIESKGFYVLAGLLEDQSSADRASRKSPPIMVAVKNQGAVHKADIIISFNL